MVCVLALDGGSRTGWALWKPSMPKPRAGTIDMPELDGNMGRWANAFIEWCENFARLNEVTDVVIEAPIIAMHRDDAGAAHVNMHEIRKLVSIVSFAEYCAYSVGAVSLQIARGTVCKHFTGIGAGKRRELKARCLLAAQTKGWNVTSEDMADALAVLDWYCHDKKLDVPWDCQPAMPGGLFSGPRGVAMPTKSEKNASAKFLNRALTFDRERA